MKVVVIGTGYVGLVSGACIAELGHEVICVDNNNEKIKLLQKNIIPIYEPGLREIVKKNVAGKRLTFDTELKKSLKDAECIILAVGTPMDEKTGAADLTYVFAAAKDVAKSLNHSAVIVTKSTVPVGTGAKVKAILDKERPDLECHVVSNPEFLREGSAVDDFLFPDRIIVGSETKVAQQVMQRVYQVLIGKGVPVLFTNIPTAELIKYASNAFLATKIAFANEIADICEGVGGDINMVIKGMGMDERIGGKYMQPGPGFGGSCFPKDTLALTHIANDAGAPTKIVHAVIDSNDARKKRMAEKIIQAAGGSVEGKVIAILGLTFKANTDDMRYSASLVVIPALIKAGATIRAYDPEGVNEAKKLLKQDAISWCEDSYDAINSADMLVVLTEWEEFKKLDLVRARQLLKQNIIVDLRNILPIDEDECGDIQYHAIGR